MNETVDPEALKRAAAAKAAPSPRKYRVGRILFWLAVVAAIGGLGYKYGYLPMTSTPTPPASHSFPAAGGASPAQTVRVAAAETGDMPIVINALGAVTPLATVTVKTQIAGRLMSVGFKEGQLVKAGDFLAQIDARPYEATLAQAEAALAKDTALRDQALADLARYTTLNKQDAIAHQTVDDQKYLAQQYQAAMASDAAQIDAAKLNIEYARIVSPIDGRVGLRLVDPGNYVQTSDSTGLVVVTELDPISVIFSTPEDNLPRITRRLRAGAKLDVAVFDRSNVKKLADGELQTFDNQIDTSTGTFKLRATFANSDNVLFPNQFVNVRLTVDTLKGAILVPNAALQIGAAGSFVYVVKDDNTVAVRKVTTGPSDSAHTVVENGLAAGERVVVDGVDRLREGSSVKIVASDAAVAPAQPGGGQHRRRKDGDATPSPSAAP